MSVENSRLQGVSASPGIASGPAFLFVVPELKVPERRSEDRELELRRLGEAVTTAVNELRSLIELVRSSLGDEYAHIFRSQQTIAEDDSIVGEVREMVLNEGICAEAALDRVFRTYIQMFDELDDGDYNKGRAADLEDVFRRVLRVLLQVEQKSLAEIDAPCIVVAEDLLPSDTALMKPELVRGIVTERGGATSHVAILARNLGIPAAVAVSGVTKQLRVGDALVLQSVENAPAAVFINPGRETLAVIQSEEEVLRARRRRIDSCKGQEPRSIDGVRFDLAVNIGSTQEIEPALAQGAVQVGLYRSEFLFMHSPKLPNEEEQFLAYKTAAEAFSEGSVIIRTLDIGGDKQVPAISMRKEENPFLGLRALRLSLARPDLFRAQVRAVLRASAFGNVKLMFPMVGGLPELDEALGHVEEIRAELSSSGTPHNAKIEIGIMIEVPSAVWVADALARKVSFFSIGTNDLTQYLLAADRLNNDVAKYYRAFDPAVFRAIAQVAEAAKANGCWVGVCGELGGNPLAIPALLGLGVSELSMSPRALPEANWLLRNSRYSDMKTLSSKVLGLSSEREILTLLEEAYQRLWGDE